MATAAIGVAKYYDDCLGAPWAGGLPPLEDAQLVATKSVPELTKLAARDSWVPFFPRWLERQLWRGAVNEALAEMQERVASALVGEYEDWSKRPAVTPASE